MKDKLRVALIGCGPLVDDYIYPTLKGQPVALAAVADPDPARLERFGAFYRCGATYRDHREMLARERPDLVLCVREMAEGLDHYYGLARDCLEAGAHAYVERPVCLTDAEAAALVELERKTGRWITTRYNRRAAASYVMAREIMGRPEFGAVSALIFKCNTGEHHSEKLFAEMHLSHMLDLARYYLGEIELTHVDRLVRSARRLGFHITFRSAEGVLGFIQSCSFQNASYPVERLEITGEGRVVIVDNLREVQYCRPSAAKSGPAPVLVDGGDVLSWVFNNVRLSHYTFYGMEERFAALIGAILRGEAPPSHMDDIERTVRLVNRFKAMAGMPA